MNKYIICVEGQGELIFTRKLLEIIHGFSNISYECFELKGNAFSGVPHSHRSPTAKAHYQILNIGNDEKVLSFIKESKTGFFSRGFQYILGLRDMYSKQYRKYSTDIDEKIIQKFIDASNSAVQELPNSASISVFFAIMELESWILAMNETFVQIDQRLTPEFINQQLDIDLESTNPERHVFHPAKLLADIFNLVDIDYSKSKSDMEKIFSNFDSTNISALINGSSKSDSFTLFFNKLHKLI